MLPHEAQAVMAKILFFIFASLIICLSRIRANENPSALLNPIVSQSFQILSK